MSNRYGPIEQRLWSKVTKTDACWLWAGAVRSRGKKTRGRMTIAGRVVQVHRVAYELTNGQIPADKLVLHRCGVGLCVRPDHLYLGTYAENAADRTRHGHTAAGERNGAAKLTRRDVGGILARLRGGESQSAIARSVGVSSGTVWKIATRRNWIAAGCPDAGEEG